MFFQERTKDKLILHYIICEYMHYLHELSYLIDWAKDSQKENSSTATCVFRVICSWNNTGKNCCETLYKAMRKEKIDLKSSYLLSDQILYSLIDTFQQRTIKGQKQNMERKIWKWSYPVERIRETLGKMGNVPGIY